MLAFLQNGFKPREDRQSVMIAARMRSGAVWSDVTIRNVSSKGILLSAKDAPSAGTYIEIRRGSVTIVGRTVWSKAPYFGVRAQDRINIRGLINEPRLDRRPAASPSPSGDGERRANGLRSGATSIEQRLDRSHRMSSALQFAMLIMAALFVAGMAATEVYDTLSKPFAIIASKL